MIISSRKLQIYIGECKVVTSEHVNRNYGLKIEFYTKSFANKRELIKNF